MYGKNNMTGGQINFIICFWGNIYGKKHTFSYEKAPSPGTVLKVNGLYCYNSVW
jgi:hypothetical protein